MRTANGAPVSDASAETPRIGDFPFPLAGGPKESPYLTWVRNHSNYMAVGGFLDYMRSAGVLLRGILINFLIFLPGLLLVSIVFAYFHHWLTRHPFLLTLCTLAIAAASILLFPIAVQLFRLSAYRRSLQTGSDSSVKKRDLYERVFGALLLLILATALLESLPWILEFFDDRLRRGTFTWPGGLATVTSTLALLSGADKLLSVLRGATKKLAIALIGVLGLLVPLSVILYASDFLLYGYPPSPIAIVIPIVGAVCLAIGIIAAIAIGVSGRTFSRHELEYALGLLIVALVLVLAGMPKAAAMATNARQKADEALALLTEPVTRLVDALNRVTRPESLDRAITDVLKETAVKSSALQKTMADVQMRPDRSETVAVPPPPFWQAVTHREALFAYYNWENLYAYWSTEQRLWKTSALLYSAKERQLIPLVDALLAQPESSLALVRPEIASVARRELALRLKGAEGESATGAREVEETLEKGLNEGAYAPDARNARNHLRELYEQDENSLSVDQLSRIANDSSSLADDLAAKLMYGKYAGLEADAAGSLKEQLTKATFPAKAIFVFLLAIVAWLGCWLTVDINVTSIHALYRDRLASAFLVGRNTKGDIDIEDDLDLHHICRHEAGSIAPYHLINVALNLQGSRDIGIRDRKSDFFIFSKRFTGGGRTGYCRSEIMEQVFPQMSLGTAMAISAAAASPNMGRSTSPLLVAFMTLLNIRLGYWVPNPGLLEERGNKAGGGATANAPAAGDGPPGFSFAEVFAEELREIEKRWGGVYPDPSQRRSLSETTREPTVRHGLVGIAFSGGGIRSAAFNLGLTQALHKRGVFDHVDYMSTVSGGGYLGSSISTLMRFRQGSGGKPLLRQGVAECQSDIAGRVVDVTESPIERTVRIEGERECREHRFTRFDSVVVHTDDRVNAGQDLIRRRDRIADRFAWQVRPLSLLREMLSWLDETHRWVNLSDGGHIENLATTELLRRRCKYIIIGDGEADPNLHFAGLATLMRCARLDLGVHIELDLDAIRLGKTPGFGEASVSVAHWAVGTIAYPEAGDRQPETGYLLYLKSSCTGDEDETIREYRNRCPTFRIRRPPISPLTKASSKPTGRSASMSPNSRSTVRTSSNRRASTGTIGPAGSREPRLASYRCRTTILIPGSKNLGRSASWRHRRPQCRRIFHAAGRARGALPLPAELRQQLSPEDVQLQG